MIRSHLRCITFRLVPGDDLVAALREKVAACRSGAACIVSCVGSLAAARVRYAGAAQASSLPGPLELLSLSGTLCEDGAHLHAVLADSVGKTTGGHLGEGCIVGTTMEVVVGLLQDVVFSRPSDSLTGSRELQIRRREEESDPVLLLP